MTLDNTFLTKRQLLKRLKKAKMPADEFDFLWQFIGDGRLCQKWNADLKKYCEGCFEDCLAVADYYASKYKYRKKVKKCQ